MKKPGGIPPGFFISVANSEALNAGERVAPLDAEGPARRAARPQRQR